MPLHKRRGTAVPAAWDGTTLISTDVDVVNFLTLFRPLAGQQAVEVFRLGRVDVLQDMGEPLPGIIPKRLARTEKGIHYGGASAYKDFLNYFYLRRMRRTPCDVSSQ